MKIMLVSFFVSLHVDHHFVRCSCIFQFLLRFNALTKKMHLSCASQANGKNYLFSTMLQLYPYFLSFNYTFVVLLVEYTMFLLSAYLCYIVKVIR